jgi:hypothetical protein
MTQQRRIRPFPRAFARRAALIVGLVVVATGVSCSSANETSHDAGSSGARDARTATDAPSDGTRDGTGDGHSHPDGGSDRTAPSACGAADGVPTAQAPTGDLCASGPASSVTGSGPWSWFCGSVGCTAPLLPPGFFVSTTGKDTNPGTVTAPFATLTKAQAAMQASSTVKTTYVRAGTYTPPTTGTCMYGSHTSAITLGSADAGETWAYYPPDGIDSAVIDGGSTSPTTGAGCAFNVGSSDHVTITGLAFKRFIVPAIWVTDSNGFVAENNVVSGQTNSPFNAAAISLNGAPGSIVRNNYIHDVAYVGIGLWNHSLDISNAVIEDNFILNSCTAPKDFAGSDEGGNDCGAIYIDDGNGLGAENQSTNIKVSGNFSRDVNAAQGMGGGGFGIYLDNGTSNVSASGNIAAGVEATCFFIHGGNDDVFQDNLCDLEADESSSLPFWTGHIMMYQTVTGSTAMTGNKFLHNVVITGSASGMRGGYAGLGSPGNPMTIQDNAYYDYAGTAVVTTGIGGAGDDASPTYEDPEVSGWSYAFSAKSPALAAPVSFPGLKGGWGPPGFVVPKTGTPPSSPH